MHLPRAVTISTVIATAVARPHAALSHEQLFPLDGSREQRHIYDRDHGDGRKQAPLHATGTSTSDAATPSHEDTSGAELILRHAAAAESFARPAIHLRPRSLAGATTAAAVVPWETAPRERRGPSHRLQMRQHSLIFNPRTLDGWYLARLGVVLASAVSGAVIGAALFTMAETATLSLLWGVFVPVFVGVTAGLLLVWLGDWAIDRLEELPADTLGMVRATAASAGLKVKFVSEAEKDDMIARAKAAGQTKQVMLG